MCTARPAETCLFFFFFLPDKLLIVSAKWTWTPRKLFASRLPQFTCLRNYVRGPCWSCRLTAALAVWHQLDSIRVNGIQPGLALLCLSQRVRSPRPASSPPTPPPQSRVLYFPNPISQRRCFIGPLQNTLNSPLFYRFHFLKTPAAPLKPSKSN